MPFDVILRLGSFVLAICSLSIAERICPLRERRRDLGPRAFNNLALLATGALLIRLLGPLSVVGAAFLAETYGFGLVYWLDLRFAVAFPVALVALDLALYGQHILLHTWTPLWRLHRVHHSDGDLDVTTGVRFHPAEVVFSVAYKFMIVVLLGAPPAAVTVFEILLNTSSLFNHANLFITARIEKPLRAFIVTPAMHWVHHSEVVAESQHNFGFALSIWDRLFHTYLAAPAGGISAMKLGVHGVARDSFSFWRLLRQPLQASTQAATDYRLRKSRTAQG